MKTDELIQLLEECPQSVAAWAVGLSPRSFRDRHVPRLESGRYNLRSVVEYMIRAAGDEALGAIQDVDSDELARWRLARAQLAETDLAERLGALTSSEVASTWVDKILSVMRAWAERIAPDNPAVLRSYLQAIRHAYTEACNRIAPPRCTAILKVQPWDGSPAFEITLGPTGDEPVVLPEDEATAKRICPNCAGELYASWRVHEDGSEEPRWYCHSINCRSNWGGLPRNVPVAAGEQGGGDHVGG